MAPPPTFLEKKRVEDGTRGFGIPASCGLVCQASPGRVRGSQGWGAPMRLEMAYPGGEAEAWRVGAWPLLAISRSPLSRL